MLTIVDGQTIPEKPCTRTKILFRCDCGNTKWICWKNYTQNHTKSCGMCKRNTSYSITNINEKHYYLKLLSGQDLSKINSNSKLWFRCDCGNKKLIVLKSVISGYTKACGCGLSHAHNKWSKPVLISKNEWFKIKLPLELLDINLPSEWSKSSTEKMSWKCNCGRVFLESFCDVYSRHRKTCSKCNFITKEEALSKQYNDLTLLDKDLPNEFHRGTYKEYYFKCKCGNIKAIRFADVLNNKQTTCGKCNFKTSEWWVNKDFGHLKVIELIDLKIGSEQKIKCLCSCGNITYPTAASLANNHTKTCGSCLEKARYWHETHSYLPLKDRLYQHNYSIGIYKKSDLEKYFEGSFFIPLEDIKSVNSYARFICKLCNREFKTKLAWIYYNKIMSCGCVSTTFSSANIEIGRFIESLGLDAVFGKNELSINNYKYDVCVPSKRLIIEHNGLRYHSSQLDKKNNQHFNNDFAKYKLAIANNYDYMMFFEDEWKTKNKLMQSIITNRLGLNKPQFKLRPQDCLIKQIGNKEVEQFYRDFHYQGHASASYNIAVYHNDVLVACMSIRRPSRQNAGDWEISRMAMNYNYRIYGLWSFLLKWIKSTKLISGILVSFSDNRIMTGKVYHNMGMKHVSDVRPEYYWVKNSKRYHKSSLRKNDVEKLSGLTETQLREENGFFKIYDLGKKKWSMLI